MTGMFPQSWVMFRSLKYNSNFVTLCNKAIWYRRIFAINKKPSPKRWFSKNFFDAQLSLPDDARMQEFQFFPVPVNARLPLQQVLARSLRAVNGPLAEPWAQILTHLTCD